MPFNASLVVTVLGFGIAIATWMKTRRLGPVLGVVVAMLVLLAITDTSIITAGADVAKRVIRWTFGLFTA